jgi:transposase
MGRAYSSDLRRRVFQDIDGGMTYADAGRKYRVSAEWVRQIVARRRTTGETEARPPLNRVVPFYRRYEQAIRGAVAERPGLTLEELRVKLGLPVSIGTLWTALQKLKLTFKKKRFTPPNGSVGMSRPVAPSSPSSASRGSIRTGSSSSTKRGSKPT